MAELKRTTTTQNAAGAETVLAAKPRGADAPARDATREALAAMGDGELAYVRVFHAADLKHIFPQSAELHPSVQLYALFGADGSPLMLADSREAILSGAWKHELSMATLH